MPRGTVNGRWFLCDPYQNSPTALNVHRGKRRGTVAVSVSRADRHVKEGRRGERGRGGGREDSQTRERGGQRR